MRIRRKRKFTKDHRRRNMIIYSFFFLFLFIGIGYATLSTTLNIGGILTVSKMSCQINGSLYKVLECEAIDGNYARVYTGNHHDSYTKEPSKNIYFWKTTTADDVNVVNEKNNVIFADQCWKIFRTTDTGGVKLLYNGPVEDNNCVSNTRAHVGFNNTSNYRYDMGNYWYGTSFVYDKANNVFSLSGTVTQSAFNASTGPNLIGKYTCRSTNQNATCSTLYYLTAVSDDISAQSLNLSTYSYSTLLGNLPFTATLNITTYQSIAYMGYMRNEVYPILNTWKSNSEVIYSSNPKNSSYWFADSVSYNSSTNNYTLVNPYQITSSSDYSTIVGKYSILKSSSTASSDTAFYIAGFNDYYFLTMDLTGGQTLSSINDTYTYGESYIDNGNGTYTVQNPTTIQRTDFITHYEDIPGKFICVNATNNTCADMRKASVAESNYYHYVNISDVYMFSNSFTYSNNTYHLDTVNSVSFFDIVNNDNYTSLNNHHYTCFNSTGECTKLIYIYKASSSKDSYAYIELENGRSLEDAFHAMLYADDVNQLDSTTKMGLDLWYDLYILPGHYDRWLEETIFCNNRNSDNYSDSGWNPNGGNVDEIIQFNFRSTDLSCPNETDQFSISNSKAYLKNNIGLLTASEMNFSCATRNCLWSSGGDFWLMTPAYVNNIDALNHMFYTNYGSTNGLSTSSNNGIRPAVSVNSNVFIVSGDGSKEYPYVLDYNG